MDVFPQEQGCFRCGGFTLDPARRVLSHDGMRIKLVERLFDVLLYLVVNHGRVVNRDELLRTIWAGRTVEDNNVGQAIFELTPGPSTRDGETPGQAHCDSKEGRRPW